MATKGKNKGFDRRQVRAKQKGSEVKRGRMAGRLCRNGWGDGINADRAERFEY